MLDTNCFQLKINPLTVLKTFFMKNNRFKLKEVKKQANRWGRNVENHINTILNYIKFMSILFQISIIATIKAFLK